VKDALVLFDVDGTLLLSYDVVYVEANREALNAVYGLAPDGPDVPGDTALAHTRLALRRAGLSDDVIDPGLRSWCEVFSRRYVALLAGADTSTWRVADNAADAIAQMERRALLTGNPEPVARARMERMCLAFLFAEGQGAFGCEREERVGLFALARERAGGWPAQRTVGVGDTPLDVRSAHDAGACSIAVTTGRYTAAELARADAVITSLDELSAAVDAL
jgi:phosphoglycolate phosphatase